MLKLMTASGLIVQMEVKGTKGGKDERRAEGKLLGLFSPFFLECLSFC